MVLECVLGVTSSIPTLIAAAGAAFVSLVCCAAVAVAAAAVGRIADCCSSCSRLHCNRLR